MNRLTYQKKLILIGVITLIVVAALAFQLISQSLDKMRFSKKELEGVVYINPIVDLMGQLQEYRQLEVSYQAGIEQDKNKLAGQRDGITRAFNAISEKNAVLGESLKTNKTWSNIQARWGKVEDENTFANFDAISAIISNIQSLIVTACDNSNLTLDPDIDTYYLMDSFCTKLPNLTEEVSLIQALGTKAIKDKTLSPGVREKILILKTLMENYNVMKIAGNIEKTLNYNPFQFPVFDPLKQSLLIQAKKAAGLLNTFLSSEIYDSLQPFYDSYSAFLEVSHQLYQKTENALKNLLMVRINKIQNMLSINLGIIILGSLLLAYLFVGIYISTLKGLNALARGSDKLAKGDLSAKVELDSKDELQEVASSFNRMKDVLYEVIHQTQGVVHGVMEGDLSRRIDSRDKQGFVKELATATNQMTETFQNIINEILTLLSAISQGDLTVQMTNEYKGVFNELKTYANSTLGNVQRLMKDIKMASETIKKASQNIVKGNNELSKRTEQQAAFLEETSISTEQLTAAVHQSAENAKQANELAKSASSVAIKGGDVVNQVIKTMSAINESSHKVADIISVIDGIAFQTNILALNAAVEAARAGEQGRGFAVVATEVRNLAQRSSAAAKEIKALINDSVENVTSGKKLVDASGGTMAEIVKAVNHVTEIMSEIKAASTEQSSGIEQVNQAVSQMDKVIAQNATLVEQAATAAESLEIQTKHMEELVSLFKLGQTPIDPNGSEGDVGASLAQKIESSFKKAQSPNYLDEQKSTKKDEWEEF